MSQFKYFSSVEGRLVTRFTSLSLPVAQYIGATRNGKVITWDTDKVVAIPQDEWLRYRKEYKKAVAGGSLVERSSAEFDAWLASSTEADNKASAKAAKSQTTKVQATPVSQDDQPAQRSTKKSS